MNLYVTRDRWRCAVSGDTWGCREVARQVPGLSWDSGRRCVVGKGDAVEVYLRRCEGELGAKVLGDSMQAPLAVRATEFEPLSPAENHRKAAELQNEGYAWALRQGWDGGILADPTGAGKTPQAIAAARDAVGRLAAKLVVCPAFLRANWQVEIGRRTSEPVWRPRSAPGLSASGWYVISYEALLDEELFRGLKEFSFQAVIFDEAHALKNLSGSGAARRARKAAELARGIPWRLALTATPVYNRRKDLWGIAEVVRPGGLGPFWPYAMRYLLAERGEYGWDLTGPHKGHPQYDEVTQELSDRLHWFYLRRPELTALLVGVNKGRRVVRWIDPPPGEIPIVPDSYGGLNPALRQSAAWKAKTAASMAKDYLAEDQKCLVFTWTREQARKIAELIGCVYVTGELTETQRHVNIKQAEMKGCLVATLDSLSQGVNLPWADVTIFADMDWLPLKLLQGEGRAWRLGRETPPLYVYLAVRGAPVDTAVVSTLIEKLDTFSDLVTDRDAKSLGDDLRKDQTEGILESILQKLRGAGPELPDLDLED